MMMIKSTKKSLEGWNLTTLDCPWKCEGGIYIYIYIYTHTHLGDFWLHFRKRRSIESCLTGLQKLWRESGLLKDTSWALTSLGICLDSSVKIFLHQKSRENELNLWTWIQLFFIPKQSYIKGNRKKKVHVAYSCLVENGCFDGIILKT